MSIAKLGWQTKRELAHFSDRLGPPTVLIGLPLIGLIIEGQLAFQQRNSRTLGAPPFSGTISTLMRIGAVNYLNSKPLVYGLDALAPPARLSSDLPSRLADSLLAGRL